MSKSRIIGKGACECLCTGTREFQMPGFYTVGKIYQYEKVIDPQGDTFYHVTMNDGYWGISLFTSSEFHEIFKVTEVSK